MCLTCDSLSVQSPEEFAGTLLQHLNGAAVALMLSVGHRTRLFDILAALPAATSPELAEAAGLNERYVREWLGAMTTARIVHHENGRFTLPRQHAAFLTRAASPNNIAATAQFVPVLGAVEDRIVECFYKGGGVPYQAYGRFHQVMAEESAQTVVAALHEGILPLAPGDRERLEHGIYVLDIGCGSGRALRALAKSFPHSRFKGYDFSVEAIGVARSEPLPNLRFEAWDAARINDVEEFDLITAFDAIHDQAHPDKVLANIRRALKPGGLFLMQDIRASSHLDNNMDHPLGTFLYTISCMHCMTVSLAQGGMGLGTVWGEEKALEMLQTAGFQTVSVHRLEHDIQNNYYLCT
jgi:SAM-dependent methyltransferase